MKNFFRKNILKTIVSIMIVSSIGISVPLISNASIADSLQAQIVSLLKQISILQTQLNTLNGNNNDSTVCPYAWSKNLSFGNNNIDVLNLQKALNTDNATLVAISGAGSIGNETSYFGSLTKNAVIKFQNKYASEVLYPIGLTSGTGYVGSMTRTKLNEMFGVCVIDTEPIIPPVVETVDIAKLTTNNPSSEFITKNASNFKMLEVKFDGTGTVNRLKVRNIGLSSNSEYNSRGGIYLYKDGVRFAQKKTLNSNNNTATFNNLNLQAPFVLSIIVDFNGSVGDIAKISLSGNYNGLPLESNSFTFSGAESGTVSFTNNGSSLSTSIVVGQNNAEVAEFKAKSTGDENIVIKHIELYNGGYDILSNVKITDGKNTWSGTINDNRFVFNVNTIIKSGRTKTFKVYADISGNENDEIELYLRNTYDVKVIGKQFGFGATVDNFFGTGTLLTLSSSGDLTVKSKTTHDTYGYWGQRIANVAKFRFTANDTEGFYIDELHFASTTSDGILSDSAEKIFITYQTKNGNTVTKTQTIDEDEDVIFDSFDSNDRPYIEKDSDMSIYVGLVLRNDDELSTRLSEDKIIDLIEYSATGASSKEEKNNVAVSTGLMRNKITSDATTLILSKSGTETLSPSDDISFSLENRSDDRIAGFSTTTGITLAFRYSTTTDSDLPGSITAKVYVDNVLVEQVSNGAFSVDSDNNFIIDGNSNGTTTIRLTDIETLELTDGDVVNIRIEFDGLDYFSRDKHDIFEVKINDRDDQIRWIDNYDSDDNATEEIVGNVENTTDALPLKFIYKD